MCKPKIGFKHIYSSIVKIIKLALISCPNLIVIVIVVEVYLTSLIGIFNNTLPMYLPNIIRERDVILPLLSLKIPISLKVLAIIYPLSVY